MIRLVGHLAGFTYELLLGTLFSSQKLWKAYWISLYCYNKLFSCEKYILGAPPHQNRLVKGNLWWCTGLGQCWPAELGSSLSNRAECEPGGQYLHTLQLINRWTYSFWRAPCGKRVLTLKDQIQFSSPCKIYEFRATSLWSIFLYVTADKPNKHICFESHNPK